MSTTDRWTQARVGLLVALAGVLLFGAVTYVGLAGTPFANRAVVHARLSDASGLAVGSRVEMGGVKIGEVTRVNLPDLDSGLVPIDLAIEPRALERIGASSRAYLGSHALVGQRFLGLTPRRPDEQPLASGGSVEEKKTVDTAVILERAGQLLTQFDGLLTDLRSMTRSLATSTGRDAGTLGLLLHDPSLAKDLRSMVGNLGRLADAAANGEGTVGTLVRDPEIARNLRDGARALASTAKRVGNGEGVLGRLTRDDAATARIDRTLENLDLVTSRLASAQGTLGALINDPRMLTQLNALVGQLDSLVADLRRNPGRYLKVEPF